MTLSLTFKLFLSLLLLTITSCEKAIIDEQTAKNNGTSTQSDGNTTVHITHLGTVLFQTDAEDTEDYPTHLCFAIYDKVGTRLKQVNQTISETDLDKANLDAANSMADFGHASFQLEPGTYQLVALAHSSTKNPTMTNLTKIQFTNSIGYSDTFLYASSVTVGTDSQMLGITLNPITALCRFVISDPIPKAVNQMEFKYVGGSGHLSALTGLGVTNSTQVVTRQVQPGQQYQVFDLYTYPHKESDTLTLYVSALNASDKSLYQREFQVPIRQNQISWYTGNFFTNKSASGQWRVMPCMAFDTHWAQEQFYTY